jgi:cystathionine gamma-synthase
MFLENPMPNIETLLAQAGCKIDPETGAVTPAVHFATTYQRESDGSYPRGFVYSRWDNPTRRLFETTLAELENGEACAAFSSGMATAMTVLQTLQPGDHVLVHDDVYHGVRALLRQTFSQWGVDFSEVDLSDSSTVVEAMKPSTRLVWAETPSNPMVRITDIKALAGICRNHGAELLVDSTWCSPYLQRPIELGADYVLHSVTKYLAGHSDVLCGALVARSEGSARFQKVRELQMGAGAVAAPFDCWLAIRGMRTLAARMRMQVASAQQVAAFLYGHPNVKRVHYPGLASHPGHLVASRQMNGYGAMLSFEVDGGESEALGVTGRVSVFIPATSLGGTESLIEHRASIESKPTRTPDSLLRLSIGLEAPEDLIGDLEHALDF